MMRSDFSEWFSEKSFFMFTEYSGGYGRRYLYLRKDSESDRGEGNGRDFDYSGEDPHTVYREIRYSEAKRPGAVAERGDPF